MLLAGTSNGVSIGLPRDLGGLPICRPMSVSTHPGQQLYVNYPSTSSARQDSPVDLKASIPSRQSLGQSDDKCLADAVCILLKTSVGFFVLADERL
jgi:hypothetical protein